MQKKYKILLSAYACEPNIGSEAGVGWNWALEIVRRGHEVWVLTRQNNQSAIEQYFSKQIQPENLHFIYYDLPKWLSFWKKGGRGVHLYYFLWQIGILSKGIKAQRKVAFDFVHHITFVTIHQPSFLFLLKGTSFFYGPAAGGDLVPRRFLSTFPFKRRIKEILKYVQNRLLIFDPIRRYMFFDADLIFCNSIQTQSFLPAKVLSKTHLNLAIGTEFCSINLKLPKKESKLNLLYVGNFLHLKGLHFGLQAFSKIDNNLNCHLTLIGGGDFNEFAFHSKNNKRVECISWIPQNQLMEAYSKFDVLFFPSFRDSGGMVVLEALAHGLPVICLNLGGPGQIVNETCGRVINTTGKSEAEVINLLTEAIIELQSSPSLLRELSHGAIKRSTEFYWRKTVSHVYMTIEDYMGKRKETKEEKR